MNIFNSALLLADPSTATDEDYDRILGVVGHEYFHNWTGNRVTVRDWFQLTLKEGLTVYRDQLFSGDCTSHAVKRIDDVKDLRKRQFAEDASALQHPIRPEAYISMDNFYTSTVYSKGAEIIRIYATLLGEQGFRDGMARYVSKFDGQAVTCDDFRNSLLEAHPLREQMERWYSQAGTPLVTVSKEYDAHAERLVVSVSQAYPGKLAQQLPVPIPLITGLLSADGKEIMATTLLLTEASQQFVFDDIPPGVIVSTLRGFSAPVILHMEQSADELAVLMAHDTDSFNRWEASNKYYTNLILNKANALESAIPDGLFAAVKTILASIAADSTQDLSLLAYALQLPDLQTLFNVHTGDLDALITARRQIKEALGHVLAQDFERVYHMLSSTSAYAFTPQEVGRRRLRNTCLDYLANTELAKRQFDEANCMSDRLSALQVLCAHPSAAKDAALQAFYTAARGDALVINKWFAIQAMAVNVSLTDLQALAAHADMHLSNPNRARSLYAIAAANIPFFHRADGSGYDFIADAVWKLDAINPQVSARLLSSSFGVWNKLDAGRKDKMRGILMDMQRGKGGQQLSPDALEIVIRLLR